MFRLLPYLIIFLSVSFTLRAFNIASDEHTISLIAELQAEEKPAATEKNTKEASPKADEPKAEPKKEEPKHEAEGNEEGGSKSKDKKEVTSDEGWQPIITNSQNAKTNLSDEEIKLLQELAARREHLDNREKEISFRENSLLMLEKGLEAKMAHLNDLQTKVSAIMQEYEKREQQKIIGLVKIYENMKPKDAARIFDELQMAILVEVADNMKEAKLAPIIAQMNSNRAKELTVAIAHRRKLDGS